VYIVSCVTGTNFQACCGGVAFHRQHNANRQYILHFSWVSNARTERREMKFSTVERKVVEFLARCEIASNATPLREQETLSFQYKYSKSISPTSNPQKKSL
jgi:hypothetical protein